MIPLRELSSDALERLKGLVETCEQSDERCTLYRQPDGSVPEVGDEVPFSVGEFQLKAVAREHLSLRDGLQVAFLVFT
jgi:hypothetical protein